MKFDYYNRNKDFNHQISLHDESEINLNSRESFKDERIHNRTVIFVLILIELLVILLGTGYYISPLNRVADVSVKGNHSIMRQNLILDMKAHPGDSVLHLINHQSRLEGLTFHKNAQLKSIHVNVHHWNSINIKVKEYPIVAYLERGHRFFAISNNGKPDHQGTKPNQINPVLYNFKSNRRLTTFIKSYKRIPAIIKPDINKIYYVPTKVDPDRIRINMEDGNLVYANFKNWDHKMKYYPAISRSMKKNGVINLELGAYSEAFKKFNRR